MYLNFYQSGNDGRIQFNQWSAQDGQPEPPIWPLQPTEPPFRPIQPPPIQPPFRPMPPVQPPIMPPMPGVQNWRGNDAAGRHVEIDWGSLGDGHDDAMDQNGGLGSEGRDWGGNGAGWSGNGADRSGNGARWNGKAGSNAGKLPSKELNFITYYDFYLLPHHNSIKGSLQEIPRFNC